MKTCEYCGRQADLIGGNLIYPHRPDLADKRFWSCHPCQAYVGCHPGTDKPLGRLANAELRAAKMAAHAAFDPLWKSGQMTRRAAYAWLSGELGMRRDLCHIGMMDAVDCRRVVDAVKAREGAR